MAYNKRSYKNFLRQITSSEHTIVQFFDSPNHGILLRHDIDYSLEQALELAKINNEMGVSATFFVMVDSPLYNLFSDSSQKALRIIIKNGQHIGLHLKAAPVLPTKTSIEGHYNILKMAVPEAKKIIAWHNPPKNLTLINDSVSKADFVNAYSPVFFQPGRYFSDSNLRPGLQKFIQKMDHVSSQLIQILIHPMIWMSESDNMESILQAALAKQLVRKADVFCENRVWQKHPETNMKKAVIKAIDEYSCPEANDCSKSESGSMAFFIDEIGWELINDLIPPDAILVFDKNRDNAWKALPTDRFRHFPYSGRQDADTLLSIMKEQNIQLGVVSSFSHILSQRIHSFPRHGTVNLHFGKLPEYRGANTLQWAIINGEPELGISLHYIDDGIDTGPVIHRETISVLQQDDAVSIRNKCIVAGKKMLREWLPRLRCGKIRAQFQDESRARYWPRRNPDQGKIDWTMENTAIRNLIRALVPPWPGAFYIDQHGKKVTIERVLSIDEIQTIRSSVGG